MHVRPQRIEKLDQVLHILVKAEAPFRHGHQPGIYPVRDVDIEIRQEFAQRVLREGGMVTGHRGDKKNFRRLGGAGMMEAAQLAKRLPNHDIFDDGRWLAADGERLIVEGLLRILSDQTQYRLDARGVVAIEATAAKRMARVRDEPVMPVQCRVHGIQQLFDESAKSVAHQNSLRVVRNR